MLQSKIEYFHGRIFRLEQEIMLTGEIVSPTRLIFQYMKALSKSDNLRSFIAPNMIDLIILLDNNGQYAVYTGEDIHGIYCYLDMIGDPTTSTASGQRSHHFSPSSSIKNDAASLQPVIAALRTREKSICECFGRIGGQTDFTSMMLMTWLV